MAKKQEKLKKVTEKLTLLTDFLKLYLPLANAHNSDFLTLDHWKNLIDPAVAGDLLDLSEEQLMFLPSGKSTSSSDEADLMTGISSLAAKSTKSWLYKPNPECTVSQKPVWNPNARPTWCHQSLGSFMKMCNTFTLANMNVLTDLEQLQAILNVKNDAKSVAIRTFMSDKKSHEVNIMAELCYQLASNFHIDKIIDVGSGKGYLGCHLSLMYGMKVLGIDSADGNTESATKRKQKLQKHWQGLLKKAILEDQGESSRKPRSRRNRMTPVENTGKEPTIEKSVSKEEQNKDKKQEVVNKSAQKACTFVPCTHFITQNTDLSGLIDQHFPHESNNCSQSYDITCEVDKLNVSEPNQEAWNTEHGQKHKCSASSDTTDRETSFVITGLHTCGNLGSSLGKLFCDMPLVQGMCIVGCCYHLLEEEFMRNPLLKPDERDPEDCGFPVSDFLTRDCCQLGRNARMLAAQPPERLVHEEKLPGSSLFWRALLQVILRDTLGELCADWHVGRIATKCTDFYDYVAKSFSKLSLSPDLIDHDKVKAYWEKYREEERKMQAFFQLKALLAPCVEALIMLDRLAFLLEQPSVQEAHLIQLFDPVVSPRCFALVAWKKTTT